jgi:periplasmic copper chaperone A
MRKKLLLLVPTLLLLFGAPAAAHVTIQPAEAPIGSFSRFVVRVPTERDDASTVKVEVRFPPLAFVSFQPKEGWKRTVTMRTLDEPLEVFGDEVTEVIDTVTWSGGNIGPGEFDEFGFSALTPEGEESLAFPSIQTYSSGEVVRWIGPTDSEEPAPLLDTIDIGAEEGEETLAVIAGLRDQVAELQAGMEGSGDAEPASAESEGSGDDGNTGVVLGSIGIVLGAIALLVAFTKRRAST